MTEDFSAEISALTTRVATLEAKIGVASTTVVDQPTTVTPVYKLPSPAAFDGTRTPAQLLTATAIPVTKAQPRLAVARGYAPKPSTAGGMAFFFGWDNGGQAFGLDMGGTADGSVVAVTWANDLVLGKNPGAECVIAVWYDGTSLGGAINGGTPTTKAAVINTAAGNLYLGGHPHEASVVNLAELEIYDQYSDALRDSVVARMVANIKTTTTVVVTTGTTTGIPTATPAQAAGMKLLFQDDFTAPLDQTKWLLGVQPDGAQWGSDSYFVPGTSPLAASVYLQSGSLLTIRAIHDTTFADPNGWGRTWYSGMISTAQPKGGANVATFRKGYGEVRMKLPGGAGTWPAIWGTNLDGDFNGATDGAVELDVIEAYGEDSLTFQTTAHNWPGSAPGQPAYASQGFQAKPQVDMTVDFHTYGWLVDANNLTVFVDGVQVSQVPVYRAATVDPFFWMINLAMGGGWPITVPANGHYDLTIDYARFYSAD